MPWDMETSKEDPAPTPPEEPADTYSCPNLPDVKVNAPGTCQHCGSALQRVGPASKKDGKKGKKRSWLPWGN